MGTLNVAERVAGGVKEVGCEDSLIREHARTSTTYLLHSPAAERSMWRQEQM